MYRRFLIVLLMLLISTGAVYAAKGKNGTRWDKTPDNFAFVDQSDVPLTTAIYSNAITVTGVNTSTTISVNGGEYAVNGGPYTALNGDVNQGDVVTVRQSSAASYLTTTDATLTVGGVSDTFSVTTQDGQVVDTTPDPFTFVDQSGVVPGSVAVSNPIQVTGINAPAPISVGGGLYAINGGAYLSVAGEVNNGDIVTVSQIASTDFDSVTHAVLTISDVSDTFSVTTATAPTDGGELVLPPLSSGDPSFTSEHFSGSANCNQCHNGLSDAGGADVSIGTDWSSSMMANAARDPFWMAKVRSELNRNPELADVINDKCTRCHAPMANEEMRRNNEYIGVFDDGILSSNNLRHDEAMDGVSCTLCHQVTDSPILGTLDGFSGEFEINETKTAYGPYGNIFAQPMINNTGFTPAYSPHIRESEVCATCHNLKTPYVDEFGNLLSQTPEDEFPEQAPYTEWLHSDYATQRSCQDCHMSRTDGVVMASRPPRVSTQRDNFAVHDFIGANKLMLGILDTNRDQLGVLSTNFAETIAKTDAMLAGAANIQLVQSALANGVLDFTLEVNSATGHKLPSAFPSRRVILHVTVRDAAGNAVFESGSVNSDGSVVGVDADSDPQAFEPHHDLITGPGQVQVYEAIMGNNHDQVTYTLLRAKQYLKDNRLLPAGFDKVTAPDDVAVRGHALGDGNFTGGRDQVNYQVAVPASGRYTVDAELVYQTVAYAFAKDLFAETDGEISDFRLMYENSNQKSTVMTTIRFDVQ